MRITEPISTVDTETLRRIFHLGPDFDIPAASEIALIFPDRDSSSTAKSVGGDLPGNRLPESPEIKTTVSVKDIWLLPGQTVTVWMGDPGSSAQVELRVSRSGACEIFLDCVESGNAEDEAVAIRSFAEWAAAS